MSHCLNLEINAVNAECLIRTSPPNRQCKLRHFGRALVWHSLNLLCLNHFYSALLHAISFESLVLSEDTDTLLSISYQSEGQEPSKCTLEIDTGTLLISLRWQNLMSLCVCSEYC